VWPIAATIPAAVTPAYRVEPAGQLGRERDHAQVAVGRLDQPVDLGRLRVGEQRGVVRASVLRAEPRALEVDPGQRAGSCELRQFADRAVQLRGGVGDQAGHDRGGAMSQVHGGHGLGGLRGPGVERRPAAAVHVRVDVPGHDGRALELHVGGARRRVRPDVRDVLALHVHPPRREDSRRGDHTSCRDDHGDPQGA